MTPTTSSRVARPSRRSSMQTCSAAVRGLALLAGLVAVLFAAEASASPQRTILHDGKIFTANPAAPWAEALIVDHGLVAEIGDEATILGHACQGDVVYDLGGRTLIPGLNDAHVHVAAPPFTMVDDPTFIPGAGPTLTELLALIQGAAETTPPGAWLGALVGTNITEDPTTTRFALDAVAGGHPVVLLAWWGHGTWLDTEGMAELGISDEAPDPFGGFYERVPGTQILTGEAHEYAEWGIRRALYDQTPDSVLVGQYQAHASVALAVGETSMQDMALGLRADRAASIVTQAALPIRVRSICFQLSPGEGCGAQGMEDTGGGEAMVRRSGMKWITDGTPIEWLSNVETAYADGPGGFGYVDVSSDPLRWFLLAGLQGSPRINQLLFHSVGDAAIDRVLDGLEATGGHAAWAGRRTRIEHGDLLFSGNFQRMRDLGVMIVQNPTHLSLTSVFQERFVPSVFSELEPLRTLLVEGIPLALGSDAVGMPPAPWTDIYLAAIHPTRPSEAITVEEAITAYTRGSAYAEFADDMKGTLAPGMVADLAVLSQDPFTVPLNCVPATTSVLTMVAGQIVWTTGAVSP
jgi:predicted amidohydrolase YtcJ